MNTMSTRDKLISILRTYPVSEEAFLHDGRGLVHPAEAFADKIMALFEDKEAITAPDPDSADFHISAQLQALGRHVRTPNRDA